MFGLPLATLLIITGIPLLWVIYTLVFFISSRHWAAEDVDELPVGEPLTGQERR